MLFIPTIAGPMSGSLGAITASHNKGGQYFRLRSTPTDPGTTQQMTMRSIMTNLSNRWSDVLTAAQRLAWETYATNVPRPNRFGGSQILSGIAHYVRSNSPRIQADPTGLGLPIVDAAPTIFNVGSFTTPSALATAPATTASVGFDNTDAWADETGSGLLLWFSRPISPAINFFKGPYRAAAGVFGVTGTPPTSPFVATLPFGVAAGQAFRFKANVTRADGRLSDAAAITGVVI